MIVITTILKTLTRSLLLWIFLSYSSFADIQNMNLSKPVDTSTPRATIESFLTLTDMIGRRYNAYKENPNPETQKALMEASTKTLALLDLREIPDAARREKGIEAFLLIWEAVARLDLPELKDIPDRLLKTEGNEKSEPLKRWRIPGSEIILTRIDNGSQTGEYLLSTDTVKHALEYYENIEHLPYKQPVPIKNLFKSAQTLTGWIISPAWTESFPDWAIVSIMGQVIWKWLALLVCFGGAFKLLFMIYQFTYSQTEPHRLPKFPRYLILPLCSFGVGLLLSYFLHYQINVTSIASAISDYLIEINYGIATVWIVWVVAAWIAEAAIKSPKINPESLDAHLIRLAARSVGIVCSLFLIFRVANQIGIPVYGLVAGAGVGGLAVALAAKNSLENFMGALNLFADRPVRIGDLCRFDDDLSAGWRPVGRIESIGIRSTRIRRADRSVITIPNAELAQRHIINLSACDSMLFNITIGIRYETSEQQLTTLLETLRKQLESNPDVVQIPADFPRVRFIGFGDSSLLIGIRAYFNTSDYNEFLAIQEDILLNIMKVVKTAGVDFAFPSITLYHAENRLSETRQHSIYPVSAHETTDNIPITK